MQVPSRGGFQYLYHYLSWPTPRDSSRAEGVPDLLGSISCELDSRAREAAEEAAEDAESEEEAFEGGVTPPLSEGHVGHRVGAVGKEGLLVGRDKMSNGGRHKERPVSKEALDWRGVRDPVLYWRGRGAWQVRDRKWRTGLGHPGY